MKQIYVLINHPVYRRIPYFVKAFNPHPFVVALYEKQHDENRPFLSKKEIEFLGEWPMCGPRYSLVKVDLPPEMS